MQVRGLLPAAVVLLWLSSSSTPVSVSGALSIGALAICGWRRLRRWSVWLSAPAALAVAVTAPYRENWVPFLVAVFVWRGAVSMARLDESVQGTGLTPVLFAISAAAAYVCLPDTEQIIPLAVVAVLVGAAAVAQPRLSFGSPGSMALVGLFGWIASSGGIGRPAGTIGALGGLGVLLVAGGLELPPEWMLFAIHVVCAAICSRIAGVSRDVAFASTVVALTLAAAVGAVTLSARRWPGQGHAEPA
jgi:hypothetical protein